MAHFLRETYTVYIYILFYICIAAVRKYLAADFSDGLFHSQVTNNFFLLDIRRSQYHFPIAGGGDVCKDIQANHATNGTQS